MPDSEHGLQRVIPDKGDSPQRRREKIIVIGTVLLVVIGILTLMRHGSNSSPDTSGSDTGNTGSDYTGGPDASGAGGGGAYGDQLAGEIGSIPEQVAAQYNAGLQKRVNNLTNQLRTARQNRQRATQRANREHKTILKQRQQIQKLSHHPAHTGKKNGTPHPAPHKKPAPKQKIGSAKATPTTIQWGSFQRGKI